MIRHRVQNQLAMNRIQITDTQPIDWVYVSEGGATIVFSYRGREDPRFDGRVLRLRKTTLLSSATPSCDIDGEEPDDPMVSFQKDFISQLVPQAFLPELDVVLLDPSWLYLLESLRDRDRPPERRMKDGIDKGRRKGVLATNLIGGEGTIAVEIKVRAKLISVLTAASHPRSPSGGSCQKHIIYQRRQRIRRHRRVGFACTRISDRRVICSRSIVLWICTRRTKRVSGKLSMIYGLPGTEAMALGTI